MYRRSANGWLETKLLVSDIAIFVLKRDVKLQLTGTKLQRHRRRLVTGVLACMPLRESFNVRV